MKPFFILLTLAIPVAASNLAEDARKLSGDFQRAKLAYAQKLDALLVKAKSEKDAAAIKTIEAMIAEVEGKKVESSSEDSNLESLVGVWKNDGSVWRFNDTKGGVVSGKHAFTMSYDKDKRRVTVIGDNWVNHLTFTANADLMNGTYEKEGRTARFKLTRVK